MLKTIFPSVYKVDLNKRLSDIENILSSGLIDCLHFDVIDSEQSTNVPDGIISLRTLSGLMKQYNICADVHILSLKPSKIVKKIVALKLDVPIRIVVHAEAEFDEIELSKVAIKNNIVFGLAFQLRTVIRPLVLPNGFSFYHLICNDEKAGLTAFQDICYDKILSVRESAGLKNEITVDCGINISNAARCLESGANHLVMGSAIFNDKSPLENLKKVVSSFAS